MASKVKLTEAQRRGLEFLARGPWVAAWWGGKPHFSWPKELPARTYNSLLGNGFIGSEFAGNFRRKVDLTPAGRAHLASSGKTGE